MNPRHRDKEVWTAAVGRLRAEVTALRTSEREWIAGRLRRIAGIQEELSRFFHRAGGPELCRQCAGECCARGRYHLTLVNVLGFLLAGEEPPAPDFSRTCPFLGPEGCRLAASRRPFNCITFNCEAVEGALSPADRAAFYALEAELRALYLAFDRRYAGSSLRGFLLRAAALGDRPILDPLEPRH